MPVPDIFLSYNREDGARAKQLADAFAAEGFEVWWDANLRSGEEYDRVTEAALRNAKAVVVLWSKRSVDSSWVRAEATQAYRSKRCCQSNRNSSLTGTAVPRSRILSS